jgi:eukaryotic-like serine/threonine-protein kinase
MLGKLLDGRYRVVQILSAGGFGETYIAEDTRRPGNPKCVLKLLKPGSADPSYLEIARRLFNTEAEMLEKLGNNDQIPRLLAYFEEKQEFYLVQELIVGHPLTRELTPGRSWQESQIIQLLQDILGVLDFVHRYNVIHRDLKPDNLIRRDEDGKLVLIDFGAVKEMRTQVVANLGESVQTVAIGTPGYMPAEQSQGKPRLNSDLYALGIIAIQAATGLLPNQLAENPENGEIMFGDRTQISPGLTQILQKMVRYHYRDRYQSASEVLYNLQQSIVATNVSQTPVYPNYPASYSPTGIDSSSDRLPPTVYPVAETIAPSSTSPISLTNLNRTLSIVRYLPFAGGVGVYWFNSPTWVILLGVSLIALGVSLFFLRSWHPKIARDYDAVFAAIFCISGLMLLFQEERLKSEIKLSEFLIAGAGIFALAESLRWRSKT